MRVFRGFPRDGVCALCFTELADFQKTPQFFLKMKDQALIAIDYVWRDSNQLPQARKALGGSGKPPPPSAAKSDAGRADLQEVADAWSQLPEQVRAAILLMARAAKERSDPAGDPERI
jgi:hypothetical protein